MVHLRLVASVSLCVAVLGSLTGQYTATDSIMRQPAVALTVTEHSAPSLHSIYITLRTTPVVAFTAATATATLSRPFSSGVVTFAIVRPRVVAHLYTCTPTRGICHMIWAWHTSAIVTLTATWSGTHQYKTARAVLTVPIHPTRYRYTGVFGSLRPTLTRVPSASAPTRVTDARPVGLFIRIVTSDSQYRCLAGRNIPIFIAPRSFPGVYLALFGGLHRSRCSAGAWVFANSVTLLKSQPNRATHGNILSLPGSLPPTQPYDAQLVFFGQGTRVALPIATWNAHNLTTRVPSSLNPGLYWVTVGWFNRFTGEPVQSDPTAAPVRIIAPPLRVIVPATTKVLSPTIVRLLRPPLRGGVYLNTRTTLTLNLTATSVVLRTLHKGDVLVIGITPSTPFGLIRRVLSIVVQRGTVHVVTAPAALRDAIHQGSFETNIVLTSGTTPNVMRPSPILIASGLSRKSFGELSLRPSITRLEDTFKHCDST